MSSPHQPPQYGQQPSPYGQSPYSAPAPSDPYSQPADAQPADSRPADPYGQAPSGGADDPFAPPAATSSPAGQGPAGQGPADQGPADQGPAGAPGPRVTMAGPPPGTDLGADISAAFAFGWKAFVANIAAVLVAGYVYMIVLFGLFMALYIGGFVALGVSAPTESGTSDGSVGGVILGIALIVIAVLVLSLGMLLWYSGVYRIGGLAVEGRRASIGNGFAGTGTVILTMLLSGLIITVGLVLLYIPGLILSVLLVFAPAAAARGASPVEAIKESFTLVKNNLGTSIVAVLITGVIGSIGGSLVITLPLAVALSVVFTVGIYERLNGRELLDPEAAR